MEYPCTVRLNDEWRGPIEAVLIKIVESSIKYSDNRAFNSIKKEINQDGIVILRTFDIGGIYQIPLYLIKIESDVVKKMREMPLNENEEYRVWKLNQSFITTF